MNDIYTYDKFEAGKVIGAASETIDAALLEQWANLYPWDAPAVQGPVPPGLVSVLMMRIYQALLAKRPPGNIHGSQRFAMTALPEAGETVDGMLRCLNKTTRGERRFVDFELTATGRGGRPLFTATLTMIWAA
jgi:acyl dehydratase